MKHPLHNRTRGAALIITLFFLVLISIITVAFLSSTRIERSAAGSHFERVRAAMLARDGVESIVAISGAKPPTLIGTGSASQVR